MELIMNDASKVQVQRVEEHSGYLRIWIIGLSREEILKIFTDVEKTKKIIVREQRISTVYERYTKCDALTEYFGKMYEVCLIQEGRSIEEVMRDVSEQITDVQLALCEMFEGLEE